MAQAIRGWYCEARFDGEVRLLLGQVNDYFQSIEPRYQGAPRFTNARYFSRGYLGGALLCHLLADDQLFCK